MALYELLLEKFFEEKPHLKAICTEPVNKLQEACSRSPADKSTSQEDINIANEQLIQILIDESIIQQLKTWEGKKGCYAMFNDELLTMLKSSCSSSSL